MAAGFWGGSRVPGYGLNRDLSPYFDYDLSHQAKVAAAQGLKRY